MKANERTLARQCAWKTEEIIEQAGRIKPSDDDLFGRIEEIYKELMGLRSRLRGLLDVLPSRHIKRIITNDKKKRSPVKDSA